MALKSTLSVLIISSSQTFYDGQAYAISSINDVGPFDILQGHSVFISLIQKYILVYRSAKEAMKIPIGRGVLTVKDDQVKIYVGF